MTAFDWNEYLILAIELQKRQDEASLRTAISRAYYFVYHTAKARPAVKQYNFNVDEGRSHQQLWELYERNDNDSCREIAMIAMRLRKRRIDADYSMVFYRVGEALEAVLDDAKECAHILSILAPEFPKPVPRRWSF